MMRAHQRLLNTTDRDNFLLNGEGWGWCVVFPLLLDIFHRDLVFEFWFIKVAVDVFHRSFP